MNYSIHHESFPEAWLAPDLPYLFNLRSSLCNFEQKGQCALRTGPAQGADEERQPLVGETSREGLQRSILFDVLGFMPSF
jgi:hypothetical protein